MNNVVKDLLPRNWRTQETHETYEAERVSAVKSDECPLCTAPSLMTYQHWKVVKNIYPYDAIATVHDLILTKRHSNGSDLTDQEIEELAELKKGELNDRYKFVLEALPKAKSIPGHFHLHLVVPKVVN